MPQLLLPRTVRTAMAAAVIAIASLSSPLRAASFVSFNPTYDFGALGVSDQALFQSGIESALAFYSSTLTTPAPLTVSILFKSVNTGLGESTTFINTVNYMDFRSALVTNAGSANDATALSFLPTGANNPVNNATDVTTSLPLLRALGFTEGDNFGGLDATVKLNTTIMNLSRSGPQDLAKYDLMQVAWHEVNEVLGFTSALNGLMNGDPFPTGFIGAADLYRYNGIGSRSFSTAASEVSYLSIDGGATQLAFYNQQQGGDFQDFDGNPPHVQDAFSTPGLQLNNGIAELTALDVIGYNVVPEPGSICFLTVGFGLIVSRRWRRREQASE